MKARQGWCCRWRMSEHTDLCPVAIKPPSSDQVIPGKAYCPTALQEQPPTLSMALCTWLLMPLPAFLVCSMCYLHMCNPIVTAKCHLQASSQGNAFNGSHHRLLTPFYERNDGAQGNTLSLRRRKSSNVSSWVSTKRWGISGEGSDWNDPSLCAVEHSCSQTIKPLQSMLLAEGVVPFWDHLQETLAPWGYSESSGENSTKIHNCSNHAVTTENCRHAWLNKQKKVGSGIVKCKLLLTSSVKLHRNS